MNFLFVTFDRFAFRSQFLAMRKSNVEVFSPSRRRSTDVRQHLLFGFTRFVLNLQIARVLFHHRRFVFVLIGRVAHLQHFRFEFLNFEFQLLIFVQQLFVEFFQLFFVTLVIGHFRTVLLDDAREHVRLQEQGLILVTDVVMRRFDLFVVRDDVAKSIGQGETVEQMRLVEFFADQIELFLLRIERREFRRDDVRHLVERQLRRRKA